MRYTHLKYFNIVSHCYTVIVSIMPTVIYRYLLYIPEPLIITAVDDKNWKEELGVRVLMYPLASGKTMGRRGSLSRQRDSMSTVTEAGGLQRH